MAQHDGPNVNEPDRNVGVYAGGADAVEKTTYPGDIHGTEPGAAPEQKPGVGAAVHPGRGVAPIAWLGLALALLALIAYGFGLFT